MQENSRKSKTHSISLSPTLTTKLDELSKKLGMSKSAIMAMALNEFIKREERQ